MPRCCLSIATIPGGKPRPENPRPIGKCWCVRRSVPVSGLWDGINFCFLKCSALCVNRDTATSPIATPVAIFPLSGLGSVLVSRISAATHTAWSLEQPWRVVTAYPRRFSVVAQLGGAASAHPRSERLSGARPYSSKPNLQPDPLHVYSEVSASEFK